MTAFSNESILTVCPQEVVLKIIEFALIADHHGKKWLQGVIDIDLTRNTRKQKPNVAVALLQTSRRVYHIARPILLRANTIRFCGSGSDILKVLKITSLRSCQMKSCNLVTLPVLDQVVFYLGTGQRKRDKSRGVKKIAESLKKATSHTHIKIKNLTLIWDLPCWTKYFQPCHFAEALFGLEVTESLTLTGCAFSSAQEEALQSIPKALKMRPRPRNFSNRLIQYVVDNSESTYDSDWSTYFFLRYEAEYGALAAEGARLKALRLAGNSCLSL